MAELLLLLCTLAEVAEGETEAAAERISDTRFLFLYAGNKSKRLTSAISSDHRNVESQLETGAATTASYNFKNFRFLYFHLQINFIVNAILKTKHDF